VRPPIIALMALGLCPGQVLADAMAGETKAQICLACHKPQHRLADMPLLEGQPATYAVVQLKAYKERRRADGTSGMQASAANLSDRDMRDISDYFEVQKVPSVAYQVDSVKAALGQNKAAEFGCMKCHLTDRNTTSVVPRLAGQAVGYSIAQLQEFADGKRVHGVGSDAAPAVSLNTEDIEALANYFAQLK
jgi:cytochrome c553